MAVRNPRRTSNQTAARCFLHREPLRKQTEITKPPLEAWLSTPDGPEFDVQAEAWIRRLGGRDPTLPLQGVKAPASFSRKLDVTLMHEAAYIGSPRLCSWLLGRGCLRDITNKENAKRFSPLYLALWWGQTTVLDWLHDHGAKCDIREPNISGWTPFLFAAWKGQVGSMKWLYENGAAADLSTRCIDGGGWTPLYYAASGGHMAAVQWLLQKGESVRKVDLTLNAQWGGTPLLASCRSGHYRLACFLITQGGAKSTDGCIDRAMLKKCRIIRCDGELMSNGADDVCHHIISWIKSVFAARNIFLCHTLPALCCRQSSSHSLNADVLRNIADFAEIPYGQSFRHIQDVAFAIYNCDSEA